MVFWSAFSDEHTREPLRLCLHPREILERSALGGDFGTMMFMYSFIYMCDGTMSVDS